MGLLDRLKFLLINHEPEIIATVQSFTETYPTTRDVYTCMLSRIETELKGGRDVAYAVFQHQENDKVFVQIIRCRREHNGALLNFAYPHQREPGQLLSELGIEFSGDCHLVKWQPRQNATYDWTNCPSHLEMAQVVEDLFAKVLGMPADFVVRGEVRVQDIPGED